MLASEFKIGERESLARAFISNLNVLVKAKPDGDRRLVEIEASVEKEDSEGDLILQKALMDSADKFVRSGHLDIDHYSEIGGDLGIPDPDSWVVGRPLEVKAGPNKSTMVKGEIFKAVDGSFNPDQRKYDALWASLISNPPVQWRASVFGYMGQDTVDCRTELCEGGPARFLVKRFDWCSLAFTRNPVNQGISSFARVVTAKAFIEGRMQLAKAGRSSLDEAVLLANNPPPYTSSPSRATMQHVNEAQTCPYCGAIAVSPTLEVMRSHFRKCCGMAAEDVDLCSHAAMYKALVARYQKGIPAIYGPGNESLDDREIKFGQRGSAS